MNVGAVRLAVACVGGAVVLCSAGCATTRTTSPRSIVVSSELVSSQPVGSGAASSVLASSQPAAPVTALASGNVDPALQKLWDLAVSAATAQGSTVKAAQAVRSTHARAVAVTSGGGVEGDQPVWVVQVEGVGEFGLQ